MQLKVGWGLVDLGWAQLGGSASSIGPARLGFPWLRYGLGPAPPECILSQACGQLLPEEGSSHDCDRGTGVQVQTQEAFCVILLSKGSHVAKPKLRGREVYSAFTGEVSATGLGLESTRLSTVPPLPAAKLCKYNMKCRSFTNASLRYHFGQNPKSLMIF